MISKTGYTKHSKHLIKILRKNRKPIKHGGAFWSSSSDKNKTTNNQKTIENLDDTYKKLETATNVAATVAAAEILVNGAAPLLAASGVGIPLLAILVLAKQIAVQYKQNLELNILLSDVTTIITNCFYLESLIKKTIKEFSPHVATALEPELAKTSNTTLINEVKQIENEGTKPETEAAKPETEAVKPETEAVKPETEAAKPETEAVKPETEAAKPEPEKQQTGGAEKNAGIDNKIQDKILEKLDILNKLLQEITPSENDKKSTFNFLRKKGERFFFSKDHKTQIINALTVINGFFIIYNSQFDWTIRYYENLIFKYYSKNPLDGKSADEILEGIWNSIETSKEFQDYLFQNEETINTALNNPSVENKIEQENKIVAENPAIQIEETGPYSTTTAETESASATSTGGPYSTATTVQPSAKPSTNTGPYSTATVGENKIGGSNKLKYIQTTRRSKKRFNQLLKKTKNKKRRDNKKYTMKKNRNNK
jgi:hypothetical protein